MRDGESVVPFVDVALLVACRKGLKGVAERSSGLRLLTPNVGDQRDHGRRVEPAGQAAADAHVADQMSAGGLREQRAEVFDARRVTDAVFGGGCQVPVWARDEVPGAGVQGERVCRRQRLHGSEQRPLGVVAIRVDEEPHHRRVVGCPVQFREREERLHLRGKNEGAGRRGVVEGLDAEPIARARQPPARAVPDGVGEHPLEMGEAIVAPVSIGLKQHLRVGPRSELVAQCFELGSQFHMVVDLPVEDDPGLRVADRHGLGAAFREVEDRQPPVAQTDGDGSTGVPLCCARKAGVAEPPGVLPAEQEPLAVRSPVCLQVVHPLQHCHIQRAAGADETYDTTHGKSLARVLAGVALRSSETMPARE